MSFLFSKAVPILMKQDSLLGQWLLIFVRKIEKKSWLLFGRYFFLLQSSFYVKLSLCLNSKRPPHFYIPCRHKVGNLKLSLISLSNINFIWITGQAYMPCTCVNVVHQIGSLFISYSSCKKVSDWSQDLTLCSTV